ncbi:MAG: sigma-54-dependent Fis family transcriptional regulator [Tidjanibacter sp.]|nr:sigma-54-dependent Fis family transcriptional regulator [Tidjanibacter sp.]MBQ5931468.1 sigma-54-dependent Fis family transcriptional regulator [Tidjanibacter sp.]
MNIFEVKQRFGIIGTSEAMNRAIEMALKVASTDLSVLITGESGVGKEFFPQIIHQNSPRKHNKYIAVNCGAIPEGTIDSELFGHERGSFTGATEARKGYFEEAGGGTIFLDEVAELPLSTQARLLRVLQSGEFLRVGSSEIRKTDVRVVAATNVDLLKAIGEGRFREDLYYRLATVPISVPPLRQRKEDIHLLFRKFASDVAVSYKMPVISLDEGARRLLENYYWKGNIRQLKNVAEQISAIEEARVITEPILRKYLPATGADNTPVVMGQRTDDYSDERELLYKVLFDMKHDILDIKRMLMEVMSGEYGGQNGQPQPQGGGDVYGLLPSHSAPYAYAEEPQDAVGEEITDEPAKPLTKEDVQREAIVKALRKSAGRRKDAAKELFMSERTLYRKIKELGIDEF